MKIIDQTLGSEIKKIWMLKEINEDHMNVLSCTEEGGIIELPIETKNIYGKHVSTLSIPPNPIEIVNDMIVLSDMQFVADKILHFIDMPEMHDNLHLYARLYWDSLMKQLLGKDGMIKNYLASVRMPNSFRGVISYDPDTYFDEVSLPTIIFNKVISIFKDSGTEPYVIMFRQPVLHADSFRKLYPVLWENKTIGLNPMYTEGMNADFDGDWIFGFIGDPEYHLEEDFSNCKFDHELLLCGEEESQLDNFAEEIKEKTEVIDLSLSPKDIFEETDVLGRLDDCSSLNADDINLWFNGVSCKRFQEENETVATGIIIQKMWIGIIANFAKMLWLLANNNNETMSSFSYFTERISQALFDSKHGLNYVFKIGIGLLEGGISVSNAKPMLESGLDFDKCKLFFDFMEELQAGKTTIRSLIKKKIPMYAAILCGSVSTNSLKGYLNRSEIVKTMLHENNNWITKKLEQKVNNIEEEI